MQFCAIHTRTFLYIRAIGFRLPDNHEVAFLQIGGGLISDKFGNIIDGKAYFRDGVGYTYGEMVKFMVETISNVIPKKFENED